MTATLYELTANMQHIMALIDAETESGEISPLLEVELDSLNVAVETKVENICRARANYAAKVEAFDAEIARLKTARDRHAAKAQWLKDYLMRCMMSLGMDAVDAGLFRLVIQKNSRPTIMLRTGAAIPGEYRRVREEFDGQKAYEDWKAGKGLPGEVQVVEGCHLRIR